MLKAFQYPVRALQLWWWRRQIRAEIRQILSKYDSMGLKSTDTALKSEMVVPYIPASKQLAAAKAHRLEDCADIQCLNILYEVAGGVDNTPSAKVLKLRR